MRGQTQIKIFMFGPKREEEIGG